MGKGIFVIGTNTDIGKTFITCGITYKLKSEGYNVIPFKPIQSGGIENQGFLIPPDIKYIKEVCDLPFEYKDMNTYCLKEEVSPHLAAKIEKKEIKKVHIINHYKRLIKEYKYVIVEGAGGIIVPLIENKYYVYDLIKDLDLDVVIVCSASVGTINHTVLTSEFLKTKNINCKGIFINQYNGNFYEDDNINIIKNLTNLDILGIVNKIDDFTKENIQKEYHKLSLEKILKLFN